MQCHLDNLGGYRNSRTSLYIYTQQDKPFHAKASLVVAAQFMQIRKV